MIVNVLIGFLDHKNVGIDTRIMILGEFIPEILPIFDFLAAILKMAILRESYMIQTAIIHFWKPQVIGFQKSTDSICP